MIDETFASGNSLVHSLNPAIRLLAALGLSFIIALTDAFRSGIGFLVLAIILILLAQLDLWKVVRRLRPLFGFLVMIWIILPLTFDGDVQFQWGWLELTGPGIDFSIKITLKSVSILLVFTALIATMSVAALGHAMHRIGVPDKLVFLLLMTYRYIAVLQEEYQRLYRAARFRGFEPSTSLHSYKTFAYLAGMLFVRASLRAERVHQAMLCRGFNRKFYSLETYPSGGLNVFFLLGVLLAAGAIAFWGAAG